ncbi:MAG TPA: DUF4349 domain-containing protein [Actinomycetota bacterium]|nr:DUF4349 domain-containing protein [Actinomycetota bacterium]
MNTDIRSLQLLERDLDAVAARERDRLASVEQAFGDGGPGGPRRLPRRGRGGGGGHSWAGVAAAVAAVLVLAGGIGFLTQGTSPLRRAVSDEPQTVELGAGGGAQTGTPAPAPEEKAATDEGVDEQMSGNALQAPSVSDASAESWATRDTAGTGPDVGAVPAQQGDLTKIVRDGRIGIVIADGSFSKGVSRVTVIARRNGGFVLSSSSRDERTGTLTLRIPAKRFDDTMLALRGLAGELDGRVDSQNITGEDVTAEFVDLGARLDILKQRRSLLRSLQNDATTSNEILRLSGLIENTQLEIENIQGRLNFLKDQVAEATIEVEVRERHAPGEEAGTDPENPSLTDSFELGVQGFLRVIGAIVVGLGYLIPVAVVAGAVYGMIRLVRRRDRVAS